MKNDTTYIIQPKNAEQESALKAFLTALKMKFELREGNPYDQEFLLKIKTSKTEAQEGELTQINKEDLKKILGL